MPEGAQVIIFFWLPLGIFLVWSWRKFGVSR